jgi:hypothetical protein
MNGEFPNDAVSDFASHSSCKSSDNLHPRQLSLAASLPYLLNSHDQALIAREWRRSVVCRLQNYVDRVTGLRVIRHA